MGLNVRYFMPPNSAAPFAFYFFGDLLNDYTNLELISTIATMETFQKIYRPEIYNANAQAGLSYKPNLKNSDHSVTRIVYDREERTHLAVEQGKFVKDFIKPYQHKFGAIHSKLCLIRSFRYLRYSNRTRCDNKTMIRAARSALRASIQIID